jgi:hypothetical protein
MDLPGEADLRKTGCPARVTAFAGSGITASGVGSRMKLRDLTVNGQGGDSGIQFATTPATAF